MAIETRLRRIGAAAAAANLPERIEHARRQRRQRHAEQIREGDPRQQHGEIELSGLPEKPGAISVTSQGMAISANERDDEERQ